MDVSETAGPGFPFSAVVGHDDLKLALILNTVDPAIGGVLLRGHKGSAKSTVARGLAALLPGEAPFVELPVGATEDRVVGTIDLRAALTSGERRLHPGLLAAAHGGVLYVDEVNLLPDHLVDVLLDVAASGVNRVEREGLSESHPSRFVLVGSMNPEEGELRPQLLDRFGLAVEAVTSSDPGERSLAVERRLDFDAGPVAFAEAWTPAEAALRSRLSRLALAAGRSTPRPDPDRVRVIGALCASVGAEGLRADLVICRAASALAAWEGRDEVSVDDVRWVAPLALSHRRRRSPLEEAGMDSDEIDRALVDALAPRADGDPHGGAPGGSAPPGGSEQSAGTGSDRGESGGSGERVAPVATGYRVAPLEERRADAPAGPSATGRRGRSAGPRGRLVGDRTADGPPATVAVGPTVSAAALRRGEAAGDGLVAPVLMAEDLREGVFEQRRAYLVVFVVDASGSMGSPRRMEAAKGAVLSLLLDAYQRRDRVALVSFGGDQARVVLRPTGSVEIARARLEAMATGGRTPLAAGIAAGLSLAESAGSGPYLPVLVVVSDGRATSAEAGCDPFEAAMEAARGVRRRGVASLVVDAEGGPARLGLTRALAEAMGASYVQMAELSGPAIADSVRSYLAGGPSGRKIDVMRSDTTGSPPGPDHTVS